MELGIGTLTCTLCLQGSVSERPKVQISKVCVVHSHPGFESQRYRHGKPRHSNEKSEWRDFCM